jgi:hypothetical protein
MKLFEKGNHKGLVYELQVISGKKITDDQFSRLYEGFEKIDWTKACQIVRDFERMERFPSNVYGVIANRIEDQYRTERQEHYKAELFRAVDADCASSVEWSLFFEITNEIILWHRIGLAERNPNGITIPMSSDEWDQAGRPATWSNILDHFMSELSKVNNFESDRRDSFLKQYLGILQSEREKRTANKKPEQEEAFS